MESIKKRAMNKLLYLRRKLGKALSLVKILAYNVLIRPILENASAIWDPWQGGLIKELEEVQTLASRIIFSNFRRSTLITGLKAQAKLQALINKRTYQ